MKLPETLFSRAVSSNKLPFIREFSSCLPSLSIYRVKYYHPCPNGRLVLPFGHLALDLGRETRFLKRSGVRQQEGEHFSSPTDQRLLSVFDANCECMLREKMARGGTRFSGAAAKSENRVFRRLLGVMLRWSTVGPGCIVDRATSAAPSPPLNLGLDSSLDYANKRTPYHRSARANSE